MKSFVWWWSLAVVCVLGCGSGGASSGAGTTGAGAGSGAGGGETSQPVTHLVGGGGTGGGKGTGVWAIALDDTRVYWTDRGQFLWSVLKTGGEPIPVANAEGNWGVAVDSVNIYWSDSDGVHSIPIAGGQPSTHSSARAQFMAADGTNLYWGEMGTTLGSLWKMPIATGTSAVLASAGQMPGALAADGTNVYWADMNDGTIRRVSSEGGSVLVLAKAQGTPVTSIAVGGGTVSWPSIGSLAVVEVPTGGGTAITTADMGGPQVVAMDQTHVYWADEQGAIRRMAIGGGEVVTLVEAPAGAARPTAIAVDSTSVYWGDSVHDQIYKTAK